MARLRVLPAALAVLALAVAPARAHEVSTTRFDAPIPIELLYLGTGITIAATALFLVFTARDRPRARRFVRRTVASPRTGLRLRKGARLVFLAAAAAAVIHGLIGRQAPAENFATVFVWALWLEGVAILAAVFGSPWRTLSPWRALYDAVVRLEADEVALLGSYPERLGRWPAVAVFVAGVGVVENLTLVPRFPRATAAVVAGYALYMFAGAILFGRRWFERADALEVLYELFGRVAPLEVSTTREGAIEVETRAPWSGCVEPVVGASTATFVVAMVYTVTFDGFANVREFQTLLFAARDLIGSSGAAALSLYVAGFVTFVAVFVLIARSTERVAGGWSGGPVDGVAALAPTLLPIAVGYEIAHYYPFVLEGLGLTLGGLVAAATGAHVSISPLWWLSLPAFWVSQVALIVGGHVVAVVAAHYAIAERTPGDRLALATVPMTALMMGYTVLSLWIVSRPVLN